MRGKQLAMDSALEDLDRYALEREKREADAIKQRLDLTAEETCNIFFADIVA